MIEFRNVSKSFWTGERRKVILDNASFKVELGNSLGILAPNGTGKTTHCQHDGGAGKAGRGRDHPEARISFPLGFMGGVVPRLSAMENCRFIARIYDKDPDYLEAFCRWVCGLGRILRHAGRDL